MHFALLSKGLNCLVCCSATKEIQNRLQQHRLNQTQNGRAPATIHIMYKVQDGFEVGTSVQVQVQIQNSDSDNSRECLTWGWEQDGGRFFIFKRITISPLPFTIHHRNKPKRKRNTYHVHNRRKHRLARIRRFVFNYICSALSKATIQEFTLPISHSPHQPYHYICGNLIVLVSILIWLSSHLISSHLISSELPQLIHMQHAA
jgi:hypothetical protein